MNQGSFDYNTAVRVVTGTEKTDEPGNLKTENLMDEQNRLCQVLCFKGKKKITLLAKYDATTTRTETGEKLFQRDELLWNQSNASQN